jgi:methylmalonyl-CoA/ethylmalonyl-CoA epimerase
VSRVYGLGEPHHFGFVVDDLDTAVSDMHDVHGVVVTVFPESHYPCDIDGARHNTVQRIGLSTGPPHVELIRAVPGTEVWRPTAGIHHIGFVVHDVPAVSAELAARGAPVWMKGALNDSSPENAVYHRDSLGLVIELLHTSAAERMAARLSG